MTRLGGEHEQRRSGGRAVGHLEIGRRVEDLSGRRTAGNADDERHDFQRCTRDVAGVQRRDVGPIVRDPEIAACRGQSDTPGIDQVRVEQGRFARLIGDKVGLLELAVVTVQWVNLDRMVNEGFRPGARRRSATLALRGGRTRRGAVAGCAGGPLETDEVLEMHA